MKRALIAVLVVVVVGGLVAGMRWRTSGGSSTPTHAAEAPATDTGESDAGVDPDLEERSADAHAGTVKVRDRVLAPAAAPAAGWNGEVQIANEDTWEPSIAADPSSGYVYALYNRYGPPCTRCPNPQMELRISSNGGQTWAAEKPICVCAKVMGQYDPVLAVSSNGTVFATWMNYNAIVFSKSTDHGATWSTPLTVSTNSWSDKPWLGVSSTGTDVYIAYESRSVLLIVSSHNGGTSFSAPVTVNSDTSVYRYPNGFAVLSAGTNGTAVLACSKYPGGSAKTAGAVDIEVWRTTNGGTAWNKVVVDNTLSTGVDFNTSSTTTIAADTAGTLVLEYSGAPTLGGNTLLYTRRSTDGGATWSARQQISSNFNGSFPAIAAKGAGDFRLTYMDSRTGVWNVWYRASTDGGVTWSADVKLSDATAGPPSYISANGFASPYGDYDAIAITNLGKSVTVSGQGASFKTGPGGIWFSRQA